MQHSWMGADPMTEASEGNRHPQLDVVERPGADHVSSFDYDGTLSCHVLQHGYKIGMATLARILDDIRLELHQLDARPEAVRVSPLVENLLLAVYRLGTALE
jgi:hypothetical protein